MAQLLQEIAGKRFQKNEAVSVSREFPAARELSQKRTANRHGRQQTKEEGEPQASGLGSRQIFIW